MKIWFDTEFIENGKTIELLSIGAVREDGREFYAEVAETDRSLASPWVAENVLPLLTGPVISKRDLAAEFVLFAGPAPEFWAYFASYDWVALCQLFGTMMDLPNGWPMWVRDLKQFAVDRGIHELGSLVPQVGEHNAVADARWTRDAWMAVAGTTDPVNSKPRVTKAKRYDELPRELAQSKPTCSGRWWNAFGCIDANCPVHFPPKTPKRGGA